VTNAIRVRGEALEAQAATESRVTRGDVQESGLILKPVALSAQSARWSDWGNGSADNIRAGGLYSPAKGRRHDRTHDLRSAKIALDQRRRPDMTEPLRDNPTLGEPFRADDRGRFAQASP